MTQSLPWAVTGILYRRQMKLQTTEFQVSNQMGAFLFTWTSPTDIAREEYIDSKQADSKLTLRPVAWSRANESPVGQTRAQLIHNSSDPYCSWWNGPHPTPKQDWLDSAFILLNQSIYNLIICRLLFSSFLSTKTHPQRVRADGSWAGPGKPSPRLYPSCVLRSVGRVPDSLLLRWSSLTYLLPPRSYIFCTRARPLQA